MRPLVPLFSLTPVADPTRPPLLGQQVTCFEILTGRTPFERSEHEAFTTPAELELYQARTAAGTWLGEWSLSRPMEDLLRRMTDPVDERRITAEEAVRHRALRDPPADVWGEVDSLRCASLQPDHQDAARSMLTPFSYLLARPFSPPDALRHAPPPTLRPPTPVESVLATKANMAPLGLDGNAIKDNGQWTHREKKTASPPKKVVRAATAAAAGAAAGRPSNANDDGVASFIRFDKTVDRRPTTKKLTSATVSTRLGASPSKERLRAAKAVKVKGPCPATLRNLTARGTDDSPFPLSVVYSPRLPSEGQRLVTPPLAHRYGLDLDCQRWHQDCLPPADPDLLGLGNPGPPAQGCLPPDVGPHRRCPLDCCGRPPNAQAAREDPHRQGRAISDGVGRSCHPKQAQARRAPLHRC